MANFRKTWAVEEKTGMDALIRARAVATGKLACTTPSVEWKGSCVVRGRCTGMPASV